MQIRPVALRPSGFALRAMMAEGGRHHMVVLINERGFTLVKPFCYLCVHSSGATERRVRPRGPMMKCGPSVR